MVDRYKLLCTNFHQLGFIVYDIKIVTFKSWSLNSNKSEHKCLHENSECMQN